MKAMIVIIINAALLMFMAGAVFSSDHRHNDSHHHDDYEHHDSHHHDDYKYHESYHNYDRYDNNNCYYNGSYNIDSYNQSPSSKKSKYYDQYRLPRDYSSKSNNQSSSSNKSKYYDQYRLPRDYTNKSNKMTGKKTSTEVIEHIFYGPVEKINPGNPSKWIVKGKEIWVTSETSVIEEKGRAVAGAYVRVGGGYSGEVFIAYIIEVQKDSKEIVRALKTAFNANHYSGKIERIPEGGFGTWIVNGKEIYVTEDTAIKQVAGKAEIGVFVKVKGDYAGKAFKALEIEVVKR